MRKIKKINGFLVVKFNDREKREYEGTALGEYGVIDAEVYTGNLDIDRGAMEYDDADTLEVAVELARGLESEEDITDEPPTYTAAVETNESYTEEAVEPAALIEGWTRRLATQVKSKHYPDTDPRTATHELYGFKMALHQIGFLPESEVITDPDTFGAGRLDGPMPRNPEELLAFVCDERCKNRAGHTQEELDAICAKCPLGQLYEDAEAQDLRIRERSERALREHIEGVRHAEDTLTALLGGHEALAYRTRLSMKGIISQWSGTRRGVLYALAALGYDRSRIELFADQDAERWAEFIIFLNSSKPSGVTNLSVIDGQVRKVKEGSSKPAYGMETIGGLIIQSWLQTGFSRYPRCGEIVCGVWPHIVSEGHLVASTVMAQGGASGGGNPFPRAGTFAASEEFYHFGAYTIYQGFASDIEAGSKAAQGAKVYLRCSTSTHCSTNAKGGAAE